MLLGKGINILTGKGEKRQIQRGKVEELIEAGEVIVRAGYENKKVQGIVRAGHENKMDF